MDRTYRVLAPSGQEVVVTTFSSPVSEKRVRARFLSEVPRDSVPKEMYQVLKEVFDSGLVREVDWDPAHGLIMFLRRGMRRGWLVNRLESILSPVATEARETQSADR